MKFEASFFCATVNLMLYRIQKNDNIFMLARLKPFQEVSLMVSLRSCVHVWCIRRAANLSCHNIEEVQRAEGGYMEGVI